MGHISTSAVSSASPIITDSSNVYTYYPSMSSLTCIIAAHPLYYTIVAEDDHCPYSVNLTTIYLIPEDPLHHGIVHSSRWDGDIPSGDVVTECRVYDGNGDVGRQCTV
jgi:hypothetical protein